MRGSIVSQVHHLFAESGINCVGHKRRNALRIARNQGARTSAQIAAKTPICGYKTADKYRDAWRLLCEFVKEPDVRFDIEALTGADVAGFLAKTIEEGRALRTFRTYAAALGKLETVLNMYAARFKTGRTYEFRTAIDDLRNEARVELQALHQTREYANPLGLINALRDPYKIAAAIQNEGGARIRETAWIVENQLRGIGYDEVTGAYVGIIHLDKTGTKGGRERDIRVSLATYGKLVKHIKTHGEYRIEHDDYRVALERAAKTTSQKYSGSHGLRYNFAQRRYQECLAKGYGPNQAKLMVAHDLGHSRIDITEWYLAQTK